MKNIILYVGGHSTNILKDNNLGNNLLILEDIKQCKTGKLK